MMDQQVYQHGLIKTKKLRMQSFQIEAIQMLKIINSMHFTDK